MMYAVCIYCMLKKSTDLTGDIRQEVFNFTINIVIFKSLVILQHIVICEAYQNKLIKIHAYHTHTQYGMVY